MGIPRSSSLVCAEICLAMTLRYLAGENILDDKRRLRVAQDEFYRSVWRMVDTLNDEFPIDLDLSDVSELQKL